MDYHLKCELCGEKVQVDSKSTSPLGAHLLVRHPDVDLTYFSSFEDLTVRRNHVCVNKFKDFVEANNKTTLRKNVISTTIESWEISTCKFLCPKCGIKDRPEIRVRTTNIVDAPFNRLLLLACWPLCFWPMSNTANSEKRLFCRSCGNDLGNFDRLKCTCKCIS
ncbi:unnamed protein product [Phyllotreta striolata]|uniref:LITAF domain-containing protein n=1 Tax=Phyllotreta striolata TaxID=444603 RepID=A0A9N9XIR4_PHYSR|nr:unnamed protein product [Phyllotreta striolata]